MREYLGKRDLGSAANHEVRNPYTYVQLSLPQSSSAGRKGKVKVLVRIPKQTTRAHARIEYFPERGEEIASSFERALWILDSFLFSRSVVARVDPSSCCIMKWDETSVSHAFASMDDGLPHSASGRHHPMDHLDCMDSRSQ